MKLETRIVASILGGVCLAALAAVVWAVWWFTWQDWLWLVLISALFTAALFGRTLLREVVGIHRSAQAVEKLYRRALILHLADSGTLTNSKPLCPHGRNKLNRTRS